MNKVITIGQNELNKKCMFLIVNYHEEDWAPVEYFRGFFCEVMDIGLDGESKTCGIEKWTTDIEEGFKFHSLCEAKMFLESISDENVKKMSEIVMFCWSEEYSIEETHWFPVKTFA